MDNFMGIPLKPLKLRSRQWRLYIKYCWYKYIRRLDIIGFYDGVPIVRTKYLEEVSKSDSPE